MVSVVLWGVDGIPRSEKQICNIRKEIDKLELSMKTDVLSEACKQA